MKFEFSNDEKQFIMHQLSYMAELAAQMYDRELAKELGRVANKFTPNSTHIDLRRGQVDVIINIVSRTISAIDKELIPNIEKSEKSEEEKTQMVSRSKALAESAGMLMKKLEDKFNGAL